MKKIIPLLCFCILPFLGQTQTASPAKNLIQEAETATNKLNELLSFSPEQAVAVKQIALNKLSDLNAIQNLETTDLKKFVEKRFVIADIADNAILNILEPHQEKVFRQYINKLQLERDRIMAISQKEGVSSSVVLKKLAALPF